jgi:L-threonylcarbamoyladenylate synthase
MDHMDEVSRTAIRLLQQGELVIYPTETFYALGCLATVHAAVERIFTLKGRPGDKPLPLIVSDWEMCGRFLRMRPAEEELARKFWPGPLSIVVEVDPSVSPLARDRHGRSAVRMTPHIVAAALCRGAGAPLVSSSANRSGHPPVSAPADLDVQLLRTGTLVVDSHPWPAGGLPSTLVRVVAPKAVRMLRVGAVSAEEISGAGFEVVF